ncbi:SagB/ThcOx family dehydrogenase [Dactylosporangium vinaceum]|uniref:SagB/ThcOx family dehydrogenase n=1 Tax=Dactylosporangium vinaceum TaxID=53362 RepID=A0ABV5MD56_9ACTN
MSADRASAIIATLERRLLLLGPQTPAEHLEKIAWLRETRAVWSEFGWPEAAEYHLTTYDYHGLDYAADGFDIDTDWMRRYAAEEPDDNRVLTFPHAARRLRLPPPHEVAADWQLADAAREPERPRRIGRDELLQLLSLAFGVIDTITPKRWTGAPLLRRTSPSGGARHPTEAFVAVLDVPGLEEGWWHVHSVGPELELLDEKHFGELELGTLFPLSYSRVPIATQVVVVLTCAFERNMYRYREPRTFRTVHMDAGHLARTVEMTAHAMGVGARVAYPDGEQDIEAQLGLDPLTHGFMLSIAIGGARQMEGAGR